MNERGNRTAAKKCMSPNITANENAKQLGSSLYSRRSRKRPPRKFENVVVTRAGRLRERALVSDRMIKQ